MEMSAWLSELTALWSQLEAMSISQFYITAGAGAGFLLLLGLWLSTRSKAKRAERRAAELLEKFEELTAHADDVEERMKHRIDTTVGSLEGRLKDELREGADAVKAKLEEAETRFAKEVDQRSGNVAERIGTLEARWKEMNRDMDKVHDRMDEVESRIPELHDEMEEFKKSLSRIFQSELGAVLDSFDGSVNTVLEQMKSELHTGIKRIEGVEKMVQSRKRAERFLLQSSSASRLEEGEEGEEIEGEDVEEALTAEFEPAADLEEENVELEMEEDVEEDDSDGELEAA